MAFSFAHISDHHLLHNEDELKLGFSPGYAFRKVLQTIGNQLAGEIDFLVSGGDLVETADFESYEVAKRMMGLRAGDTAPGPGTLNAEGLEGLPIYFLPGNHGDRENFYRGLYPKQVSYGLMNVGFEHKGVQFLCLDLSPEVKGDMSDETFGSLSARLTDQPTIILTHHPLVKVGAKWLDKYLADDLDRFWDFVSKKKVLATLSGHVHISYEQEVRGVQVMGTRSTAFAFAPQDEKLICLWPPHIRVVTVDGERITSRLIEVPLD
jgi:3',5'-cyclic AMP phosphodiesterase CpdA